MSRAGSLHSSTDSRGARGRVGLVWALAAAAVIVGAVLLYRGVARDPQGSSDNTEALPTSVLAEPGSVCSFDVGFRAKVTAQLPLFVLDLRGGLTLRTLGDDEAPGSRTIEAKLAPRLVDLKTNPDQSADLRNRMSQRVVLRTSADGRFVGVSFPEADRDSRVDGVARSTLRSLLAALQLSRPEHADVKQWTSIERDLTGSYRAQYNATGVQRFDKKKLGYVQIRHAQAAGARTEIDTSLAKLQTDEGLGALAIVQMELAERTHTTGAGAFPRLDSDTTVKVSRVECRHETVVAAKAGQKDFAPLDAVDERDVVRSARTEALAGATWRDLAEDVVRLEESGEPAKKARAYSNLAAALRYRNDAVAEAKAEILTQAGSRSLLIHALGDAGSPEAQRALTELSEANLTETNRRDIVYALSMVETPTQETTQFLKSIVDDDVHGVQARYGVGVNAFYARERDPEFASDAVAFLATRLERSTARSDTISFIRALGNAAHPDVYPLVEPYLADERTTVRVAAVDALRRVPGGKVDAAVAKVLSDPDRSVRLAAAGSMGYRDPTPTMVYALRDALLGERDEGIRLELVRVARDWLEHARALRPALIQISRDDSSEKVRDAASRALIRASD